LFDERRDPQARVEPTDWCANMAPDRAALYSAETVAQRRAWYLTLLNLGRL
jgi:hypothetical protein